MNFKKAIIFTFSCFTSILLEGMNQQTRQLLPDEEYPIDHNAPRSSKEKCTYTCYPKTYTDYTCKERGCNAVIGFTPTLCCVGIRELITDCDIWASNQSTSFLQAHTQMWCTKDAWFPCCCNTRQEVCTSVVGNCSTGIIIASITYALCLFLPCVTKKGCTFIKKKNNPKN